MQAEPGTALGVTRYVQDADELYHTVLSDVLAQREEIVGGETKSIGSQKRSKEILHYSVVIAEPRERLLHNEKRKFNLPLAVARFIWMMAGNDRLKDIEFYEPRAGAFSDDGIVVPGSSYGHRMLYPAPGCDQISGVISRLREDAATRRAAIAVFQPQDVTRPSSDIPCTFGLAFHNRGEFLHPAVIMRSNNAFALLPYNIFEFSLLGEAVAAEVGLKLGVMSYYAMSMHVYASNYEKAKDVIRTPATPRIAAAPVMPIDPPPLGQIHELVMIEAEVRHAAAGFSAANFESKWLPFADSRLVPYWRQFYYVLLFAICQRVDFHSGLARLREFIDEPWLGCLPPDKAAAPALQLVAQGDLFPDVAKHPSIKPRSLAKSKAPVREDSTVLSRADLEKELEHVLKLYQPYVARDQWSRVLEHQPIFLRRATTSSDKLNNVLNRLRALRFSLEAGDKVESNRARAEVIIRALDELTVE